ncbi:MAG: serine protease [Anaerolineae bacterium]|nr:serine protease [Anaerolineae bacterium]
MTWNSALTQLSITLAGYYPTEKMAMQIVKQSTMNSSLVDYEGSPATRWFSIVDEAIKQSKLSQLAARAAQDYAGDSILRYASNHDLSQASAVTINGLESVCDVAQDFVEGDYEVLTSTQQTLLPIQTLLTGWQMAQSVCKITRGDGGPATGFMIQNGLLLTNNHVIANSQEAQKAIIEFNYQGDITGYVDQNKVKRFQLAPDQGFATSDKQTGDDWTAVKVKGDTSEFGTIPLKKLDSGPKENEYTFIIQHPSGLPKQISFFHNTTIASKKANRVRYLTDTLPGSSGSPVFDQNWKLIALHHWGEVKSNNSSRKFAYNQGIHINAVVDGLTTKGLL